MRKKEEKTNAMRVLDQKGIFYKIHSYVNTNAISGIDVANVLQENPNVVFKTLVTESKTGNHYVFLVPVNKELDLKKASKTVGEKSISMLKQSKLLPLTGYIHGGCSPIGMKKLFKTVIDISANDYDKIIFSGGKIGYQIEISLMDLKKAISFELSDIISARMENMI